MKTRLNSLLILLCGFLSTSLTAANAPPPNIVFTFVDWGWGDLGCHGHSYVRTPNIERLAKERTDFHSQPASVLEYAVRVAQPEGTALLFTTTSGTFLRE